MVFFLVCGVFGGFIVYIEVGVFGIGVMIVGGGIIMMMVVGGGGIVMIMIGGDDKVINFIYIVDLVI